MGLNGLEVEIEWLGISRCGPSETRSSRAVNQFTSIHPFAVRYRERVLDLTGGDGTGRD